MTKAFFKSFYESLQPRLQRTPLKSKKNWFKMSMHVQTILLKAAYISRELRIRKSLLIYVTRFIDVRLGDKVF